MRDRRRETYSGRHLPGLPGGMGGYRNAAREGNDFRALKSAAVEPCILPGFGKPGAVFCSPATARSRWLAPQRGRPPSGLPQPAYPWITTVFNSVISWTAYLGPSLPMPLSPNPP